jgi:NADH dehydrogenase FAD-containing subunit
MITCGGHDDNIPNTFSAKERRTVMTQPSTRILVLGAGIAGLLFTLRLAGKVARESVQITLVDESDTFTVRPRLHEFATNQRVFQRSFPQILRKTHVQFLQARVTSLDPSQHRVTVQDQQQQQHELAYDYLVYALGSMTDRHSVPGVAEYAYSLSAKGPFSAEALRETLPEIEARGGQVIVCGGGATGIETAAQVASVYPQIKVSLVTQGSLALSWNKSVADAIRRRLVSLRVEIVEHSDVRAVRAHSVVLNQGRELDCDLCIWTGGFVVPPLAKDAGLPVNERDQVLVDPFLRSVSHQEIYAIGDTASPVENPGVTRVRMSAFTASIMGAHAADCLSAILTGQAPKPLSFAYLAQAIALGRHHAIFFLLSPDDRPRQPYITGWLGSLVRVAVVNFVVTATLAQHRFPAAFAWPGKGRYEQAQRLSLSQKEHPSLPVHHLS